MTLLSDVIKASPIGGYIASIRLVGEGLLLVATLALGMALHHAYEAEGSLKASVAQEYATVSAYQKQAEQQRASCAATDAILNKTDMTKDTISHETDNSLREVAQIAAEFEGHTPKQHPAISGASPSGQGTNPTDARPDSAARDAALLGVLNTAYCQASHYGDNATCVPPR